MPTCHRARWIRRTGRGASGRPSSRPVHEGGVRSPVGQRRDRGTRRARDRDDGPAAAPAEELVAEAQGRVAADDDQARGLRAREQADLAALDDAVRHRP